MGLTVNEAEPRLVEKVDALIGSIPGYETYTKLLNRVVKRIKSVYPIIPFVESEYNSIGFRIFRYGPFSVCRMTYECGNWQLTGFGMAEKSHRDPEHPQAGKNIAFSRAATQLFNKYAAQAKY